MTTRKYMAECLNRGEPGLALSIYRTGLKLQTLIAASITSVGLALVLVTGDQSQRWISAVLVVAILPRMVVLIPSQANNAAERMRRNAGPALTGYTMNIGLTWFSLWIGWGLYGIAASLVVSAV